MASVVKVATMPLSLYDPSTRSLRAVTSGALPELTCAAVADEPGLTLLRQSAVSDLLLRQLPFRTYEPDLALLSALRQAAAQELGGRCEGETVRYWLISAHYRSELSLRSLSEAKANSDASPLEEWERRLGYLYGSKQRLRDLPRERVVPVQTAPAEALAGLPDALGQALDDDLDAPRALAAVDTFLLGVNELCDAALRKSGRVNASAVEAAQSGFALVDGLLGLGGEDSRVFLRRVRDRRARARQIDIAFVDRLVAERAAARANKDFATADRLQSELLALGVCLLDTPAGASWTLA